MRVTKFGDNLLQVTRMWVINMYLVRETDGLTLIDSGTRGSEKDILAAAKATGLPLQRVVLTHAHVDHAGSFDALRAALPDAAFLTGARTADFLRGDKSLKPGEVLSELRGGFVQAETVPDRLLVPGDQVGSLRVLAAPGHSPDQIAFLDERDGTLIAGDAYQTQGGIAVSGVLRWRFPMPAMATWDLATAVQTARDLAALQPARLAVGHGRVLEQPGAAMARAIAEAEGKLDVHAQTA
ncbi:MAG: MBL fold metallo-hydrolase [Candidatus Promineifilaceae bacterium]